MSEGLRCRFSAIEGETPKGILGASLVMPAVLGNLEVEEEAQHAEYTTVSDGQFSQGAQGGQTARMLRAVTLEGLTLTWDAKWLVASGQDPEAVRGQLLAILRSKRAVSMLLTVGRPPTSSPELRMDVTFRSVRRTMKAGETDTRYFNVSIKEWRDPSAKRRGSKASRKRGTKLPTTIKLTAADTLQSLAHSYYGSYSDWRDIRDANGISTKFGQSTPIVSLPRYKVGSTLKIPKIKVKS